MGVAVTARRAAFRWGHLRREKGPGGYRTPSASAVPGPRVSLRPPDARLVARRNVSRMHPRFVDQPSKHGLKSEGVPYGI